MKMVDGVEMVGTQEAADKIGIGRSTILRYCDRGLPFHQVMRNNRRWFDMVEVWAWIRRQNQ